MRKSLAPPRRLLAAAVTHEQIFAERQLRRRARVRRALLRSGWRRGDGSGGEQRTAREGRAALVLEAVLRQQPLCVEAGQFDRAVVHCGPGEQDQHAAELQPAAERPGLSVAPARDDVKERELAQPDGDGAEGVEDGVPH
eukprot:scaffold1672_cov75-Phaeocystis_antarctica.AAC.9